MFRHLIILLIASALSLPAAVAQTIAASHIVESGENIEIIAARYGVTPDAIISLNPEAKDYIYIGMELKIPASEKSDNSPKKEKLKKLGDKALSVLGVRGKVLKAGHDAYKSKRKGASALIGTKRNPDNSASTDAHPQENEVEKPLTDSTACADCGGNGLCHTCNGTGCYNADGTLTDCPDCYIVYGKRTGKCRKCSGSGKPH